MADEVARTALVFDATQAKKGAEEFAQAGQKVISADDAVEKSATETAAAVEAAEKRKTTARQKAASDAKTAVEAEAAVVTTATNRTVSSMRDQERFLATLARRYDPLNAAVQRHANELRRLDGIIAAGGPLAERAMSQREGAMRRLQQAQDAVALSAGQSANIQDAGLRKVAESQNAVMAVAQRMAPVLAGAFSVGAIVQFGQAIVQAGDQVAMLQGRFTALSGSASQGREAVQQVFDIASKTGASINDTGQAFSRFYLASKSLGATQAEAARLVETVQKLGIIGGASASEVANGSIQLAQALASGVLRGDELNSILENMPLVARQIADGLGVNIGQLRAMGAEGQLTADKVFGALQKGAAETDKQFAQMPVTVERASGEMTVAMGRFLASLNEGIGLSRALASAIQGVANVLNGLSAPRTASTIADGLRSQIAALEKQAEQQRTMGLIGNANRLDANIANLRTALGLTEEMVLQESRLAAQRKIAQQGIADAAKTAAAEAQATKEAIAAQKELEKVLSGLDPKYKAMRTFSDTVMALDKALSEGNITVQEHARYIGLAAKAHDEATKKADGLNKKIKEKKISFDSLNESVKQATAVALEHERRLASGSKEYEAIIKADRDLASQLTQQFIPAHEKAAAKLETFGRLLAQEMITQETYAAAVANTNRELQDADPAFKAAQQAAADYAREVERVIGRTTDRIVDFGADTLFDVLNGKSKDFWEDFKDLALRTFAQIAADAVLRPIIEPIVRQVAGYAPGLLGVSSSGAASGGGSSGFSLPNISGGGLLDKGWSWLFGSGAGAATLPTGVVAASGPVSAITSGSTVGMFTSEAAMAGSGFATGSGTAAAGAGFLSGAMSWMPWVALAMMGKQIFNSFGPTGNKIGIGLLGPSIEEIFAKPELAIAPLIGLPFLNMFMNMKESNKGAEYSFMTDADWTTQFEGDKHPEQMALVKSFSEPLQDAIVRMEDRLGIRRQDDATIGANFGIKEGNSFFYDRGPRDGGIENRQIFKFDPEDAASVQSALDGLMMAFVKDADWSAIGARIGEQAAADVAIALDNSAATTLDELLADISFAESFNTFADLGSGALDPLALATKTFADAGKAAAASVATAADTFKTKANDLGLGLEVLEDGTTRADQATKGYVMSLLGLEAPMTELQAATITAEAYVAELTPTLERLGFTADEVATITAAAIDKMTQAAQQAAIAAQTASTNLLNSTIYGSNYQPPADSFLYGLVGSRYEIPAGGGAFAPLVSALERTRSGDRAALEEVFTRTAANLGKGVFTEQERAAVEQYAAGLYNQAQQRLIRNNPGTPANDNGSVISSGGSSGGAANDNSARDAINEQIDSLRDLADIQNDAAREAGRLADAFKNAADSLRLYRLGLLTDPTNNPASLGDQLAEAQRQQASALARVLAGGPDAPDAARELQQVSDTVLSLGRSVFGSSPQYVALFDRTIGMLTQAEGAAQTFEQQQLSLQSVANSELARLNTQIEQLRGQLSSSSGGGGSTGGGSTGGGGTTGGGTTGGSYAFGYSGLGRQQGESADAFIRRQFPKVAASMGSAVITEQAGYNWAQSLHASGLSGLTNAGYFSAALKAGFPGPFVGSAHTDFLSPGGVAVDARWQSFITELRKLTTVPVGFFGYPFAHGGLVTGGTPGMDSVPAMLMPGERVFSVPHSRIIEGLAARAGNDNGGVVSELRRTNAILERRLGMMEARLAQIDKGQERGNKTRDEMRSDARSMAAARAPKVGSAPIRSGRQHAA